MNKCLKSVLEDQQEQESFYLIYAGVGGGNKVVFFGELFFFPGLTPHLESI